MAGTMSVVMADTEERAKESAERTSLFQDEDALLLQEDAHLLLCPDAGHVHDGDIVKAKVIKEKASGSKQSDEIKSKQKSKRSLIPFYSTFGFGNKSSKSPDKEKKRKGKVDLKSLNNDENEEENEKRDKEKEEEEEREKEIELIRDLNLRRDSELHIDNRLYSEMSCENEDVDDEIPQEFIVKKEIKSPKLTSKGIGDSKKYSLVKSRIAKYQKNSQKDRCSSPEASNSCKGSILHKSKTLDNQSKSSASKSKYATLDVVRSKFQNQVNNLSYEGVDFAGTMAERDIEYDKQELYDELKLIYDGEEIYAVREHKTEPHYSNEEPVIHRPHLSIDSITLISNKNMKASLNISVSGNPDRVVNALPDTRWKETGKFSRRSLRKSSYKKNKDAKKKKASSGNSSNSSSPPNELDLSMDTKSCHSGGSVTNIIKEHIDDYQQSAPFPEYAKVNKKKNLSTEALTTIDNLCLDYRKTAFKGCSDKGPVAKKIGQSVGKNRRETEGNIKVGGPVKKTESFKGTKVGRKGSFTYSSRPKIVKRPVSVQQIQQQEATGNLVKTQAVKLRRRDSQSGRKGEYRLSVTIQPSTVASLTDKFNSLCSQNQTTTETAGKTQTQIALGQVSVKDGKLGRVYHSPRASFKRKYRTRSHKNRRSAKMEAAERPVDPHDLPTTNELEEPVEGTSQPVELSSPRRTKEVSRGPRIVNIKKVPSIGRAPGDNKTDEEKVYDKIETALSSGKFKGETDESDVDQDETVAASCYEEVSRTCETSVNRSDDEATALTLPPEGDTESMVSPGNNKDTDSAVSSMPDQSSTKDGETGIIHAALKSSSVENLTPLAGSSHQKSESIDSGILSDENSSTQVTHKIPETVEEVTYGINGAIDHCSLDTNNSLATCKSEDSGVDINSTSKFTASTEDDAVVSLTTNEELENNHTKESERDTFKDYKEVSCVLYNEETDTSAAIQEEEVPMMQTDSEADQVPVSLDRCTEQSRSEDCVSDTDNKIYSSILKAVVKNTVRRTKEKDSLKRELDKENSLQEKESWFKRNKSKERGEAKSIEKLKCTEPDEGNDERSPVSSESKPTVECDRNDKLATKENMTKQKKEKDGKIYESWIFKKFREKSQERKKFKDFTPVEVSVEDDNSKPMKDDETAIIESSSEKISQSNVDDNAEDIIPNETLEKKTTRPSEEKSDGYGLFSFKSRGRNKDKKRTKTTPDKLSEADAVAVKDGLENVRDCTPEESINSSPASSVKTQHSRKPSDTSVCTVESENVSGKSSVTKLKASNSQRSTSSIPPPPKTPIPSPPKSARIVLNMNDDELNDDNDGSAKGSAENIYENLYSTNIDKLKKNCVKLEESGIVPNTSFLWSYANPPSLPTAFLPSTSDGRTRTPERQTPFIKITGIKSFGRPEKVRRDTSLPRMDQSSDDAHNYSELNQISSDDSHTTVAYDEIGGLSAVSYDDVRMSSSCSYDDVRAPSSVGYDSLKAPSSGGGYDPVNPPPARSDSSQYDECDGAVVTAQLVVVREDQLDSISYLYDDITYNSSQSSNSYEPVNPPGVGGPCAAIGGVAAAVPVPPLSITSIQEVPEPENSPPPLEEGEDEEECGSVHEVFSYKLTRVGPATSSDTASVALATPELGDTVNSNTTLNSEAESSSREVPSSSPVSSAAPEPIYGSQEAVYGRASSSIPEGESVAASPIGLRDSLRSSTSSYHSAYSTKYFTRTKMLESMKSKEDERISAIATIEQRNNKKSSKSSDDYKESRLGFMGRKFRELGKLGKAKNVEKDAQKKGENIYADRKSTAPPTKNKLIEKNTRTEKQQNSERCSDRTSLASLSEDIYGETTYGIVSVSGMAAKNITEQVVEHPSGTKKKVKKPNLKLSDCPPLDDDFTSISEVFVTPKEIEETYGPVMDYNSFGQSKQRYQSENQFHGRSLTRQNHNVFVEMNEDKQIKKLNVDQRSSLVKETLRLMMGEGSGHDLGLQDEWEDIGDDSADEEEDWESNRVPRQVIRVPVRTRRWAAQPRVWRKTWSQGVRDITQGARSSTHRTSHDMGVCKSSHRSAGTVGHSLDMRSLGVKCELQGRSLYHDQIYYRGSPTTSQRHQGAHPRSHSEPALQHKSQGGKSGARSRDGSCRKMPSLTPRERLCDHHHLVLGRFKSRKNKCRLQDDSRPASEGRYRKRCHPDSDGEGDAASHYEAIYEAINELQQHGHHDPRYPLGPDAGLEEEPREDFDDSFDSDDSDEAYSRLQPQLPDDGCLPSQLDRQESQGSGDLCSSSPYERQGSVGSAASGGTQQSITKIAEAANIGMRRLRRNWSQTKTEVKTGLNKMKKKGNAADMKSIENIYNDASPTSDEKRKWSFKNHFVRRKSTSSLVSPTHAPLSLCPVDKEKETATFYLTLTIETDKREAALAAAAAEASKRLQGMDLVKNMELLEGVNGKDLKSVLDLGRISDVGVTQRPKSCVGKVSDDRSGGYKGRSKSAQRRVSHPRPVRPKNAPPAPPSDFSESEDGRSPECEDLSKDKLALRLNQLLSSGPASHRGRRVLRSHCSSSDSSPVPLLLPPDPSPTSPTAPSPFPKSHIVSASSATSSYSTRGGMLPSRNKSPSSSRGSTLLGSGRSTLKPSVSCNQLNVEENCARLSEEIACCISRNIPNTRCSVVSASSSEGYIRPSDIASIPPPLPARPTGQQQRLKKASSHDDGTASSSNPATPVRTTIPEALPSPEYRPYLEFSVDSSGGHQLMQQTEEEPTYMSSQFADEPLYQFYTASVLERATYRQGECSSEDDYEVINDGSAGNAMAVIPRPTAMEIVTPADGRRTLWCELSEVASSGILNTLSSCQRKVQEAMFEVITSEASYLKSLEVLVSHFFNCPSFGPNGVLTKRDKNILFSDILPVKRCSELFLVDLEKRWQESALINTIADIVLTHASSTFSVYVKYCSNQIYQDRMLKELKENNPRFVEVLAELEASPKCQSLAMHSFLMLPMQRITRLPLLLDAIFHRLERGSPHWHECNLALATLNKVVTECNEGARKMERMEEMLIITRQLDFREVRAVPLISASRWLVKKGELTRLTWRDLDTKLTFGKRISKHSLYFFLFTDLLVVTKKKSEESYAVLDHCPRNMVQVMELDTNDKPPPGRWLEGHKNLLIVTMLQNHENKTVEMVLSCGLESERTRWVEAVTPRTSDNPDEQIYEEWDCPQVQATHAYSGSQPDELSLDVSDVVNVLKKMADGWYQGERLRDGERGWFPGSYCKEIASAHVRARNLRQRYRLLTLSCSMVEELRRNASTSSGGGAGDLDETKDGVALEKEDKKERRKTITIQDVIHSHSMK